MGLLNIFLWCADLWFLYKETMWFQNRGGIVNQPMGMQQDNQFETDQFQGQQQFQQQDMQQQQQYYGGYEQQQQQMGGYEQQQQGGYSQQY